MRSMTYSPRHARVPHAADKLMHHLTTVSETIRKPLITKAQIALGKRRIKYGEERFLIWRMKFFHPAMWHVALG